MCLIHLLYQYNLYTMAKIGFWRVWFNEVIKNSDFAQLGLND